MEKFEKSVPFDPGYSKISFSFMANIEDITREFHNLKTMHQKKFKLSQIEPKIVDMIVKSTSFYLGCMLWGGFLNAKFKNEPKEISGNYTLALSPEEQKEIDCTMETTFTIEYIKQFNRDCKYYLNKTAKIPELINEILISYNEFASINNHFINVEKTSDIKLPKDLEHFDKLTETQLDELYTEIQNIISSGKIENMLELGFYPV